MDCMPLMRSPDEWDVPLGLKLLSVCRWGGAGGAQMSSKLCRTRTSDAHTSADVHAGGMPSRPVTHRRGTGGRPGLRGHLGPAECEIPISTSELCMSGLKKASRRAALMPSRSARGWGSGREGGRDDFYQARSGLAATLSKQAAAGSAPRRTQSPNPVRDGRDNGRARVALGFPPRQAPGLFGLLCSQT